MSRNFNGQVGDGLNVHSGRGRRFRHRGAGSVPGTGITPNRPPWSMPGPTCPRRSVPGSWRGSRSLVRARGKFPKAERARRFRPSVAAKNIPGSAESTPEFEESADFSGKCRVDLDEALPFRYHPPEVKRGCDGYNI